MDGRWREALSFRRLRAKIAHFAMDKDLSLRAAALQLGFVSEAEFDSVVDPTKMVRPHVAQAS
jgi:fumarate hydratase, class II